MAGLPKPDANATCLITGASSGIGAAIARELASRGYGLTLVARREDRLRAVAAELEQMRGSRIEVLSADLSEPESWSAVPEELEHLSLRVDVLVNNAGFGSSGRFVELDRAKEAEQVRLMCEAPVALCGTFVPAMVKRRSGAVLIMSSTTGFQPTATYATYAAAKAFSLSFGQSLRAEVRSSGVSVTTVAPGPVKTGFFASNDMQAVRLPGAMWVSAEQVAKEALRGLARNKRIVIPNRAMRVLMASSRVAPTPLQLATMKLLLAEGRRTSR